MKRRHFLGTTIGASFALNPIWNKAKAFAGQDDKFLNFSSEGLLTISSANGLSATEKAMSMMVDGGDVLDAVIAGVNIVEDDPNDHSVGYGGLPNERGVVELDSCVMHGPTHNAGSVASLRNIKNPSKVARLVMERTDHELLAGKGALEFAKAHGFKEVDLLTDKAREIWLHWKETLSDRDDWFTGINDEIPRNVKDFFKITGTISCLGLDKNRDICGVTTTSGLAFKIPGRVGDSPIIGAGLYVDNEIGACGSTGRGEENLKNLTCFLVVEFMRQGMSPGEACTAALKRVVRHAKMPELLKDDGKPAFNLKMYALNKKGIYGAASIYGPAKFAANDGKENVHREMNYLYLRK